MWRTDPEIARFMYTDLSEPSIDRQKAWIASVNNRQDYRAFMILDESTPIGFLSYSDIDYLHKRCSTGSYIYERQYRLKFAVTLHAYICSYAFDRLGCHKIVNSVMGGNEAVIKLQTLHKTRLVGCLKEHIYKNGQFHDVHLFELLKSDWEQQQKPFSKERIKAAFADWSEQ